jgi:hypothetical protein
VCIAAAKRNFKCLTWSPKDHFEILLKATCQHHSYHVKHKLKDYTMMKNFMTSRAFSKGSKPGGDIGGKSAPPIPDEAEVVTIFN